MAYFTPNPTREAAVIKRYEAGESIYSIAKGLGVSRTVIYHYLKKTGAFKVTRFPEPPRGPSGAT